MASRTKLLEGSRVIVQAAVLDDHTIDDALAARATSP